MTNLVGIIEETINGFGRDTCEIKYFLQSLMDNKELQVYNFEINKEIIETDVEDEKVVRTIKGATLEPTNNIRPNSAFTFESYFLEDPVTETKYILETDSCSVNSSFEHFGHRYGHCSIARLVKNPDLRKLKTLFKLHDQLDIPKKMIDGSLYYSWEDWGDYTQEGTCHLKSGKLRSEGEQDNLFKRVCEFVRGK